MVTLPSRQAVPEAHRARQIAESFGVDAERYDRARPRYPEEMVARIIAASPGREVLDVGCGTGIASRQFQAAGCTVLGVEPDERMAEFARRTGLAVEVSTFEAWDPTGRTFDAVVAATAWHWVDPVAGAAKAAQVLRPHGRLAAFWHVFELPPPVAEAFAQVYRRVVPDSPFTLTLDNTKRAVDAYQPQFTKAANSMREVAAFTEPEQWHFEWQQTYTRDEWLDQLPTQGTLTRLPGDKQTEIVESVGNAIDELGGHVTMSNSTVVVTTTRTTTT